MLAQLPDADPVGVGPRLGGEPILVEPLEQVPKRLTVGFAVVDELALDDLALTLADPLIGIGLELEA